MVTERVPAYRATHVSTDTLGETHMLPEILQVTSDDISTTECLLSAVGEIDHDSRHLLRDAADDALERGRIRLAVDLSAVTFCDSGGLSLFVELHRDTTARGGWLRLAGPQGRVMDVLRAANLDGYLSLHPTVREVFDSGR